MRASLTNLGLVRTRGCHVADTFVKPACPNLPGFRSGLAHTAAGLGLLKLGLEQD